MRHPPHIFVALHHKVGTVWMMTTFMRIAKANGWGYVHLNEGETGWDLRDDKQSFFEANRVVSETEQPELPVIFNNYHADIPDLSACKDERGARGIHLVRDPRDMLLSAVRFHLKANEPWLDEPQSRWDGMSFRDKLNACGSQEEQVAFEMDTYMGWTIERMAKFDAQGVFIDVKYEDLITDVGMRRFHEVLVHLGMQGRDLVNGLGAYWDSSLFGERSEHDKLATAGHVFDSGVMQWRTAMSDSCVELVESRFGWAIERLGYPLSSTIAC